MNQQVKKSIALKGWLFCGRGSFREKLYFESEPQTKTDTMDLEKKPPQDGQGPPEVPNTPPPPPPGGQQRGPGPGQPFGPGPGRPPGPMPLSESDTKMWATLAHLGFAIGGFITPLVIWQIYKDRSEFVAQHGKEALNWQLTMLIGFIICIPLFFIVIGIFLLLILSVVNIILGIMALMAANKGEPYTYPFRIQFVK